MSRINPDHLVEIRDFREEDTARVARLWHDSWASSGLSTPDDPTVDGYRKRLERERWSIRLACLHGEIVGFVAFQADQDWLRQLFVEPTAKRTGVGTALLDAAKREMPGGFWLRTDLDNEAARRFYESRCLRLKSEEAHPLSGLMSAVYLWP